MDTKLAEPRRQALAERLQPGFTDQLIEPFSRFRSELDRLFDDFPFRLPTMRAASAFSMAVPAIEMTETKRAYKITAELPGIDPNEVEISVEDDFLRLSGEKKTEREEDEKGYHLSERSYGAFERTIRLPAGAQADKIKARCRNGVLTLTIPKNGKAEERVRKIAVEQA